MKLVKANGKTMLHLTQREWMQIGNDNKWIEVDAKKKQKMDEGSPFAICNTTVGTEKTPKRERCIQDIKKQIKEDKKD